MTKEKGHYLSRSDPIERPCSLLTCLTHIERPKSSSLVSALQLNNPITKSEAQWEGAIAPVAPLDSRLDFPSYESFS